MKLSNGLDQHVEKLSKLRIKSIMKEQNQFKKKDDKEHSNELHDLIIDRLKVVQIGTSKHVHA